MPSAQSPPPPALSRAEYTASTRARAYTAKRAQSDKIVSAVGKHRRDDVTPRALRQAQAHASRFFTRAPVVAPPPPGPPSPSE